MGRIGKILQLWIVNSVKNSENWLKNQLLASFIILRIDSIHFPTLYKNWFEYQIVLKSCTRVFSMIPCARIRVKSTFSSP